MNNQILNSYVENFCDQYDIGVNKFLLFSTYQICKKNKLDENMLIDSVVEGGGDGGFDSIVILVDKKYIYSLNEFNEYLESINENSKVELFFIQTKETSGIKENAFMKMKDAFQNLLVENHIPENLKLQYNPILIEKFELINEIIVKSAPKTTNIYFNIAYAYTGRKNKDSLSLGAKNKMESIVSIIVAKTYVKKENISVEIYDSTKLIDIANKSIQKDYIIKYQTIFKMNYCSNSENGFVMNMSLKDYYNLITQDNEILDELFEGNIRDFEGQTVEVNKNIKDIELITITNAM